VEQVAGQALSDVQLDDAMMEMDADGNGTVELPEFRNWCAARVRAREVGVEWEWRAPACGRYDDLMKQGGGDFSAAVGQLQLAAAIGERSKVRARLGHLSGLSGLHSKYSLCGGFVWARQGA
jgi:hypothetical protein